MGTLLFRLSIKYVDSLKMRAIVTILSLMTALGESQGKYFTASLQANNETHIKDAIPVDDNVTVLGPRACQFCGPGITLHLSADYSNCETSCRNSKCPGWGACMERKKCMYLCMKE